MSETNKNYATKKCAVVTGANKGIGLEICRQLASIGVAVVLTARDEKKGVEAIEKLRGSGLFDVVFHQLDVLDPASIANLADFIKTQSGKLDILVNNAGISGVRLDDGAEKALMTVAVSLCNFIHFKFKSWERIYVLRYLIELLLLIQPDAKWSKYQELAKHTNESVEECLQANYYGAKRVTEALLPLLQLSDSPRLVNVSSGLGRLQYVSDAGAKAVLSDVDSLTEEGVDEVLKKFQKDFEDGLLETQGLSVYIMSKAAMNAYTRILAKKLPKFRINCVTPGFVKTDINYNTGYLTVEEGAEGPVKLALLPDDGPSGLFFAQKEVSNF
ncbi:(+)-neomenthol dehydrogenase-like isoform X1 [Telopea speciosissima]|uniref:(+)-neomenthol dehydrogenase-like isoform X1 n=1 Tax=Telopea speciosissima TaxID=54955 RepID=UPI001CC4D1BC|nr:(+)-neomenthol dehydrogenase-like isoform X1 [Telopea speciosissima]